MPNLNNIVMLVSQPEKPMSIATAKLQGFTDFTFYPTAYDAKWAAIERETLTGRKTISFDETVKVSGHEFVLHVLGETPRPKPRVKVALPRRAHNAKLDAFAVFMGEWAAKLKKMIS